MANLNNPENKKNEIQDFGESVSWFSIAEKARKTNSEIGGSEALKAFAKEALKKYNDDRDEYFVGHSDAGIKARANEIVSAYQQAFIKACDEQDGSLKMTSNAVNLYAVQDFGKRYVDYDFNRALRQFIANDGNLSKGGCPEIEFANYMSKFYGSQNDSVLSGKTANAGRGFHVPLEVMNPNFSLKILENLSDEESRKGISEKDSDRMRLFMGKNPFLQAHIKNTNQRFAESWSAGTIGGVTATAIGGSVQTNEYRPDLFVPSLYIATQLKKMGIRSIAVSHNIDIPKQLTKQSASWLAEGASNPQTNFNLSKTSTSPKRIGLNNWLSWSLFINSQLPISQIQMSDALNQIAVAVDASQISGTGTNNDLIGILNQPGITAITLPVTPRKIDILNFKTQLLIQNLNDSMFGDYLSSPAVYQYMSEVRRDSANTTSLYLIGENNRVFDGRALEVSNNVPTNLGAGTNQTPLIFGDWSQALEVLYGTIFVTVDNLSGADAAVVKINFNQYQDFTMLRNFGLAVGLSAWTPVA